MKFYSDVIPSTTVQNSGGMTTGTTTLVVGAPMHTLLAGFPYLLRLDQGTANEEIVLVVSGAGTTGTPYVIRRAMGQGQTAKSHVVGAAVTHPYSASDAADGQKNGKTTTTTVNTSVVETVLLGAAGSTASLTLPANYATPGTVLRAVAFGTIGTTGTPTVQFRARLGGVAGVLLADTTALSAPTTVSSNIRIEVEAICLTDGATSTWQTLLSVYNQKAGGTSLYTTAGNNPVLLVAPTTSGAVDVTAAKDLVITIQWGTSNVANTISITSGYTAIN
jgi:hypothetical protein